MDFRKILKLKNLNPKKTESIKPFLDLGLINKEVVLGGGALRTLLNPNDVVCDYDLFFVTDNILKLRSLKTMTESKILAAKGEKIFQCPKDELRSYRWEGMKIQLITLDGTMYDSVESIINSFDINASRLAYNGEIFYVAPRAITDIRKKTITLHKITYALATCKRICRYGQKGFSNTEAFKDILEYAYNAGRDDFEIDMETVYVD